MNASTDGLITTADNLIKDLKKMHELRTKHFIEDCDPKMTKLWEWYCLELMKRCSRRDWEWGNEKSRREKYFSNCTYAGDEAFLMTHLETRIERYCAIREAKANKT